MLHFQPRRYDRWEQNLEVTVGELIPGEQVPLLKRRRQLSREEAISLWSRMRLQGWKPCPPQWQPPPPPARLRVCSAMARATALPGLPDPDHLSAFPRSCR